MPRDGGPYEGRSDAVRIVDFELCAPFGVGERVSGTAPYMAPVSEERRAKLAQSMPRARASSVWVFVAGLGLMLALGTAAGSWIAGGDEETRARGAEVDMGEPEGAEARIEELTNETRLAASKAYWIVPGDEAEQATALHWIGVLEDGQGPLAEPAKVRAGELRREIAATLVRLGDRYWDAEHGRSFALEYYAMAQVFDPELELDGERAPLTPAQLSDLIARAERGEFTLAERRAAKVMAILADDDVERQRERVAALVEADGDSSPLHASEELAELVELEPGPTSELEDETGDTGRGDDDGDDPRLGRRSAEAAALVAQGQAAAARGDRAAARRAFVDALEADRRSVAALTGLAELHFEAGQYSKALRHARKASTLRPKDGDLAILLGDCYLETLRYGSAHKAYAKAEELGHARAQARLANLERLSE